MGRLKAILACLWLTGCAVAEYNYPVAWEPLVTQPDSDCREFLGRFADRGQREDEPTKPSLSRQLFGEFSNWENATAVEFAMPKDGVLVATVSGNDGPLFARTLVRGDRDYLCQGGRLIVRDRRWIAGYIVSGRQRIDIELNIDGPRIVTQVEEMTYGVMFVIFPVVGTARHWYRFERLKQ
jgi:hypothetical protein